MQHLLRSQQFSVEGLTKLYDMADRMRVTFGRKPDRQGMRTFLAGTLMHAIFYEASTRTRFSFESGAQHLGMSVVSTDNAAQFSSAVKGETLEDSIRVHAGYAPDVIVLRHPEDGAAERAAAVVDASGHACHVINAGDGRGQHPTQALLDAYTIDRHYGRIEGLTVLMGGDLANGRTVRSLAYLLGKYSEMRIIFVSPPQLAVGADILEYLDRHGVRHDQVSDMESVLPEADVVYWTRLQVERIADRGFAHEMRELQRASFTIRARHLRLLKERTIILHPFPRKGEIATEVDADPRAYYFHQAENGMYVRMALLFSLIKELPL